MCAIPRCATSNWARRQREAVELRGVHRDLRPIFVAGPAGAQRYADHGVLIPAEKFQVIDGPQLVGALERATGASRPATVLYAPTWRAASPICS